MKRFILVEHLNDKTIVDINLIKTIEIDHCYLQGMIRLKDKEETIIYFDKEKFDDIVNELSWADLL